MSRRGRAATTLAPLRFRHFRSLFAAHLVSNLGDWLAFLALFGLVAVEWRANALRVSMLAVAYALPLVVVAPVAGVFVDRWDLRRVLVASDLSRAAILVAMAYRPDFAVLCVLLFLQQGLGSFFNPAQAAALPQIVPRTQLLAANALTNGAAQLSKLLGPGVAGVLVAAFGSRGCFLADAVSFAASAAWLGTLPALPARVRARGGKTGREASPSVTDPAGSEMLPAALEAPPKAARSPAAPSSSFRGVWTELLAGLRFVWHTPSVHLAAILLTAAMIALGAFIAVIGVHARDALGMQARGMGLLISMVGAGAVLGALLVARLPASVGRLRAIAGGMLLGGMALVLVAWSHDRHIAFAGVCVVGISTAATLIPGHTLVQETTPAELLGRVMSCIVTSVGLAQAAGMAASGALATHAGTRAVLVAAGLVMGGVGLLSFGISAVARPRLRSGPSSR